MSRSILAGIETEYGLLIEGRGVETQVDDSATFVRSYPGPCFVGWNYRYESPRADLRGFVLDRLAVDPIDAQFESRTELRPDDEIRSDRVLPNGARFYNDHGHPEYSTPECFSIEGLAAADAAGQRVLLAAARAYEQATGHKAKVYKNNTDFHGASYGTHESYLVPRVLGFEKLFAAVTPMLIARQILVGAGKVGAESGSVCDYQISQRADFFVEPANAETLYRRPVFNTRDEAHANPHDWIRLHVIAGDANMISSATARKIGLVKLALALAKIGEAPQWDIEAPHEAFRAVSRDDSYDFLVKLGNRSWTTAYEILESYFAAAEATLDLDDDLRWTIDTSRLLLPFIKDDFIEFSRHADWAAKYRVLNSYREDENLLWSDPALRAVDLEYHNVDPDEGLHAALEEMGEVVANPPATRQEQILSQSEERTRAYARGFAVAKFGAQLRGACWRSLTFERNGALEEFELRPDAEYPAELGELDDVGSFIDCLRGVS